MLICYHILSHIQLSWVVWATKLKIDGMRDANEQTAKTSTETSCSYLEQIALIELWHSYKLALVMCIFL